MSLLWTTAVEGEYHHGVFYLPTHAVEHYDLPDDPDDPEAHIDKDRPAGGDDDWSWNDLESSIRQHGIRQPIEVGKSIHDGTDTPLAYNGNHRLAIAKKVGLPHVPCVHSDGDDAEPLTKDEVHALGGWGEGER